MRPRVVAEAFWAGLRRLRQGAVVLTPQQVTQSLWQQTGVPPGMEQRAKAHKENEREKNKKNKRRRRRRRRKKTTTRTFL